MAAHCSFVASCAHGWDLFKSSAFCASFQEISSIACTCKHPIGSHKSIAGAKQDGVYLSQLTAEYPSSLAQQLAACMAKYTTRLGHQNADISDFAQFLPEEYVPRRPRLCDGAGLNSTADFTHPEPSVLDSLCNAIQHWMSQGNRMHSVMSSLAQSRPTHPLSEEQQLELLDLTHRILHPECQRSACCAVSAGQPFRLNLLRKH